MRACARTRLDGNSWQLTERDGTEQRVREWQDLDWTRAADDAQARQDDRLHSLLFTEMEIGKELGKGTSGIAYQCLFPSLSTEPLTVKLPRSMFARPMLLYFTKNNKLHETSDSSDSDNDSQWTHEEDADDRKQRAIDNFSDEFDNYEKIYVVPALRMTGTGHVTRAQHARLLNDQFKMEMKQGRAHIHRIVHFDARVPALFSEQCDGTLARYRRSNTRGLFDAKRLATSWDMSDEWLRVGGQVGSAVTYMREMGVAHCDINVNNVFYRLRNGYAHYLVADFGLCHSLELENDYYECQTTHYFQPKQWEHTAVDRYGSVVSYNPFTLVVYTFAILMVNCLKLPHVLFPYSLETPDYDRYHCIADEISRVKNDAITALFPFEPSASFCELYPEWSHVVKILNYDYVLGRSQSTQPLFDNLLAAIANKPIISAAAQLEQLAV